MIVLGSQAIEKPELITNFKGIIFDLKMVDQPSGLLIQINYTTLFCEKHGF